MNQCSSGGYYSSPRISSEYKDCSLPLTFDQYNICGYGIGKSKIGCLYCFSNTERITNPAYKGVFKLKALNVNKFIEEHNGKRPNPYYDNFYRYRFPLHWGGLSEPFCPIERKQKVGLEILKYLSKTVYPVIFSTKGVFQCYEKEYLDIWETYKDSKNLGFSFSIISNSDEVAEEVEVNVPSTTERLKAMKVLADMGFWCVLRLRPFIIGITDIGLEELLTRAKDSGARAISMEFYCTDFRSFVECKDRIDRLSQITKIDIPEFYKKLSPTERGTYCRLNRLAKEPFMERIFKKCKELDLKIGISDPDFKEYNFSGNCCGYPQDKNIYNSEICNSSKGQLTYLLSNLRKEYWKSEGKIKYLTFDMIEKTMANDWGSEPRYYTDSIKYWLSDFHKHTQGHINEFKESWNNLRASDNIYNYFHGILIPVSLDKKGMIIYEYKPTKSELRLRNKGIE
jgi:DNA repair photolyase